MGYFKKTTDKSTIYQTPQAPREVNCPVPGCWNGALSLSDRSVGLPAQEGRDIELVFLGRIMHRRGPTVGVETLRSGAPGIFRDRVRDSAFRMAAFRITGRRPLRRGELRHR